MHIVENLKQSFGKRISPTIIEMKLRQGLDASLREECHSCKFLGACQAPLLGDGEKCLNMMYDSSKPSILIIDDNPSIVSFLQEDMECLDSKGIIDLNTHNLIPITGNYAAFSLYTLLQRGEGLNITHAVIDLNYSGSINVGGNIIKYTGVDVYEFLQEFNPGVKVLFYSNPLNTGIKSQSRMVTQFKELTGGNLQEYILHKTTLNIKKRRAELSERLFNKDFSLH